MAKALAIIGDQTCYLAYNYGEHGDLIGMEWIPAEVFNSWEEAEEYLREKEDELLNHEQHN